MTMVIIFLQILINFCRDAMSNDEQQMYELPIQSAINNLASLCSERITQYISSQYNSILYPAECQGVHGYLSQQYSNFPQMYETEQGSEVLEDAFGI